MLNKNNLKIRHINNINRMSESICKNCNEEKPRSEFMSGRNMCRQCNNNIRVRNRKNKLLDQDLDELKQCSSCKEEKCSNQFLVNCNQCNDCINKKRRERRASKNQTKIDAGEKKISKISQTEGNQICPYCKKDQSIDNFRKKRQKCKTCEQSNGRDYRKSDIGKEKSKAWVDENPEKMKELQAEWFQDNKEKITKKNNERYHNDYEYKLKSITSSRIRIALKKSKCVKNHRTLKYLGAKIDDFKKWLEYNFTSEMNMDNHGIYWHMDHVIPINTFKLSDDEQAKMCFNWKNVVPLKCSENLSKHDKICSDQISNHMASLSKYNKEKIKKKNDTISLNTYMQLCATHLAESGTS